MSTALIPSKNSLVSRQVSDTDHRTVFWNAHGQEISAVRFSPSGGLLATSALESDVQLWRGAEKYESVALLKRHRFPVRDVAWCSDLFLFSASSDGFVNLWDIETEQCICGSQTDSRAIINSIHVLPSTTLVLMASDDRTVQCSDIRIKNGTVRVFENNIPCTTVVSSSCGSNLYVGDIAGRIHRYDFASTDRLDTTQAHSSVITSLSCQKEQLLSTALEGQSKVWDIRPYVEVGKELLWETQGQEYPGEQILYRSAWLVTKKDTILVPSAKSPYEIILWSMEGHSEAPHREVMSTAHTSLITVVEAHPTETVVASATLGGTVECRQLPA